MTIFTGGFMLRVWGFEAQQAQRKVQHLRIGTTKAHQITH